MTARPLLIGGNKDRVMPPDAPSRIATRVCGRSESWKRISLVPGKRDHATSRVTFTSNSNIGDLENAASRHHGCVQNQQQFFEKPRVVAAIASNATRWPNALSVRHQISRSAIPPGDRECVTHQHLDRSSGCEADHEIGAPKPFHQPLTALR